MISPEASLKDAIVAVTAGGALMSCVVNQDRELLGIVTDSDIRRSLLSGADLGDSIHAWYQSNPVTGFVHHTTEELLSLTRESNVRELPLLDSDGRLQDIFVVQAHEVKVSITDLVSEVPKPPLANYMMIMAGGLGTRLRSVIGDQPKPLAMVGNRPILETLIVRAQNSGFQNFIVSVNYMADQVIEFLSAEKFANLNIKFVRENQRLGTAGAIGLSKEFVNLPLMICNADVLTTIPFDLVIRDHYARNSQVTCVVKPYAVSIPYGVVVLGESGEIRNMKEKPRFQHLVNTGIYVFNPEICHGVKKDSPLDMPDLINQCLRNRFRVNPFLMHEYWTDIGQPEDYWTANNSFNTYFEEMSR